MREIDKNGHKSKGEEKVKEKVEKERKRGQIKTNHTEIERQTDNKIDKIEEIEGEEEKEEEKEKGIIAARR